MAEIKRTQVVYTYGPEGRDACWAALANSWNELARRQNESSSSHKLKAWTRTQQPEGTNEIDSTTRTMTTTTTVPETDVVAETAAVEMAAVTPPPMPMMRSPPRLERRVAGGGYHRRHSYSDWDTPHGGNGMDGFRPFDLAKLMVQFRSPDRENLADSCSNNDFWHKFGWNDDAAAVAAEPVPEHWSPPPGRADDGSNRSRPSTPPSLPSTVVVDEEPMVSVDEHEDAVDEHGVTAVAVDADEPTLTAVVEEDGLASSGTTPPPNRCTGKDEAHDDEHSVDKPIPWAAESLEMKIKEIDDTIVSYSKSLLITVLVVVLIRVLF